MTPEQIFDELVKADPGLEAQKAKLIPLIERLMKEKPEAPIDEMFFARLKNQLLTKASMQKERSLNPFTLALLGSALTLVIAVPATYELTKSGSIPASFEAPRIAFSDFGKSGFGTLSFSGSGAENTRSMSMNSGMGGMGGGGMATDAASEAPMIASDSKIAYWPSTNYVYKYKGELDLSHIKDTVYRKTGTLGVNAGTLLSAKVGPFDLSAFSGSNVDSFSIKQSDKNGYSVYVGSDGSVSASINEGYWTTLGGSGTVSEENTPSDEEILKTADNFLKKYQISTRDYGTPIVDRRNFAYALMAKSMGMEAYFPDSYTVTYPLMLDGEQAVNSDGSPNGISVTVNVSTNTVTGVWAQSYNSIDRSSYALETDTDKILSVASRGGIYGYNYEDAEKTVEVELGEPEVVLMAYWQYDGASGQNLFVPALRFPILNRPDDASFYQDAVVVPLPQDILNNVEVPVYRILDDVKPEPAAE